MDNNKLLPILAFFLGAGLAIFGSVILKTNKNKTSSKDTPVLQLYYKESTVFNSVEKGSISSITYTDGEGHEWGSFVLNNDEPTLIIKLLDDKEMKNATEKSAD